MPRGRRRGRQATKSEECVEKSVDLKDEAKLEDTDPADKINKAKMNEGGSPIYIDSGSDEDGRKSTHSMLDTTSSPNEKNISTEHTYATNLTDETVNDKPGDGASGSNTKAGLSDKAEAGQSSVPKSGQPSVVLNVTNVTINISPNSSAIGNRTIEISDDDLDKSIRERISVSSQSRKAVNVAEPIMIDDMDLNESTAGNSSQVSATSATALNNQSRQTGVRINQDEANSQNTAPGSSRNGEANSAARGRSRYFKKSRGAGRNKNQFGNLSRNGRAAKATATKSRSSSNYSSCGVSAAQGIVVGAANVNNAAAAANNISDTINAAVGNNAAGTNNIGKAVIGAVNYISEAANNVGTVINAAVANIAAAVTNAAAANGAATGMNAGRALNGTLAGPSRNVAGPSSLSNSAANVPYSKCAYTSKCNCSHCDENSDDDDSGEDELNNTVNILLGSNRHRGFVPRQETGAGAHTHLSSEAATQRMQGVFRKGLESKLNATQMEPCKGILTPLHPHQKAALAWMCNQENKENQGMIGGILGDDMGLGKTLTIITLILTNFHDKQPLAKRSYGFTRPPIGTGKRTGGGRKKKSVLNPILPVAPVVRTKGNAPVKLSSFKFFANSNDDEKENIAGPSTSSGTKPKNNQSISAKDEGLLSSDSDFEIDDFDIMFKDSKTSLRSKFDLTKKETVEDPEEEGNQDTYKNWDALTQQQKDDLYRDSLNPKLNLDGFYESDSDEDFQPKRKKPNVNSISSDEDEDDAPAPKQAKVTYNDDDTSDSDVRVSDIDLDDDEIPRSSTYHTNILHVPEPTSPENDLSDQKDTKPELEPEKQKPSFTPKEEQADRSSERPALKRDSRTPLKHIPSTSFYPINRIVPPKEPAVRGNRRRPTLIVCPTSLISHWCAEIDKHVEANINIKVRVHYGPTKAQIGAELNACDIVITTYGTLAAEYNTEGEGPLMKAKWLRVVLDEGHYIKNHRTKTAKAAKELNTLRRWVVTGTPIQNNLLELWSLVHWLQFELYAESMNDFKHAIERPCKNREEIGFERLQTLMDTICLRRTKNDKKENGDPIVKLPSKTIIMRDVEFTEDEQFCYDLMKQKATEIVARYQKRGQLMRNYAHILVLMLRLRQMCCHRELVKEVDWQSTLHDKDSLERELGILAEAEANLGGVNPDDPNDPEMAKALAEKLSQMIREGVTEDCSICLEDLKTPVITLCSHIYCRECIERVIDNTKPPLCPLCRGNVKKTELLAASDPPADEDNEADNKSKDTLKQVEEIEYSFSSSKVNAAIKELIRIKKDFPDDKMIVVSQFTSFLSIIQPLLTQEGFSFVRLDGTMSQSDRKETIDVFQSQGPNSPSVLLLSLKAGGVGLNLTAANHLLLMDPAWNPASEWQCFDRIHRMGQTKESFIYKFITRNESIEETMLQIQARKEDIINGAFHMPDDERRRQRINEILTIFNLHPPRVGGGGAGPDPQP